MMRFFKKLFIGIIALIMLAFLVGVGLYIKKANTVKEKYRLLGEKAPIIKLNGQAFKDLNKNGKVDPYEDFRNPVETRVEDL